MNSLEKAVLATILMDGSLIHRARALGLIEAHFGGIANKRIWSAMCGLASDGHDIDMLTLVGRLEQMKTFDTVGGHAYLQTLDLDMPDPSRLADYVTGVINAAVGRKVTDVGKEISVIPQHGGTTEEVLAKMQVKVREALDLANSQLRVTTAETAIDELVIKLEDGIDQGMSTGFHGLDLSLGGVRPGNLIVLAGRPGMGKTSLAVNMAHHQVRTLEKRAGFFSLEMSAQELMVRLLAAETGIPVTKIRVSALGQEDWDAIVRARRRIATYPLFIEDSGGITVDELASKATEMVMANQVDIIYVDYLQLMASERGSGNRTEAVSEISRQLKKTAKDLKVPIVAVSQLSRETEKRTNKRPMLSDLRESGSIEQDADAVVFVFRPGYYKTIDTTNGQTDLIIAKNRSGPTGQTCVRWNAGTNEFRNME
jgi:replicative DNA helicase